MNKWLKYGLLALGAGVLLLVIGAVIFVSTFDPNQYKTQIVEAVKKATGRDLAFQGDVKVSVFPWIGADVGGVTLGNAPGFGDKPMVSFTSAKVRIKLLPLLSGSVEMGKVSLDNLTLNLARAKDGRTNWDDLAGKGEDKGAAPASAPSKSGGELSLAVGGLAITNANIFWEDAKEGKSYAVREVNLETGAIDPGDPFDFKLAFALDSTEPELRTRNVLSGVATLDTGAKRYAVKDFKLSVQAQGKAVPGGKVEAVLAAAQAQTDLKAQTGGLSGLVFTAYNLKVTGQADAAKILDGPEASGQLEIAPFDVKELLRSLGQAPLETADPEALKQVSAKLSFKTAKGKASVDKLLVKLDQTTLEAAASIQNFAKPFYALTAQVDSIDVDRYLPPKKQGGGSPSGQSSGASGGSGEVIPVKVIRDLGMDARLDVGKLKISGLRLSDVKVRAQAKDGLLTVDPAELLLYGGSLASALSIDCRPDTPHSAARATLSKVQLGPLLKDMSGKDNIDGNLNLKADLRTTGATVPALKRGLGGNLALDIHDGVFPGVDLEAMIKAVMSAGGKSGTVQGKSSDRTPFGSITATAVAANGVIVNRDLDVRSPNVRADGEGQVNLPADSIDYLVRARLVAATSSDTGLLVPVRIKGSLSDPSFGVDLAEYFKGAAAGLVKGVGGAVQGVGGAIGGAVEGVFGGGKKKESSGTPTQQTQPQQEPKKKGGALEGLKKLF
ncbi:MAG TPA: AsmA family protein [Desulfovibrio sp.]|uniref:AsmA family protein n=1 Tax=Desulfovibrio sp. TaxID=885 RepID=UPI002D0B94A5|nr:AsmA family protein [Desulfovibrio sp.]HMM38973.1 AsmA family protein [Desulfovibrio sp.]